MLIGLNAYRDLYMKNLKKIKNKPKIEYYQLKGVSIYAGTYRNWEVAFCSNTTKTSFKRFELKNNSSNF